MTDASERTPWWYYKSIAWWPIIFVLVGGITLFLARSRVDLSTWDKVGLAGSVGLVALVVTFAVQSLPECLDEMD